MGDRSSPKSSSMLPLGKILESFTLDDKGGKITREFQDYGYRLAVELNDLGHKSLYIKMARDVDRGILESARSFVLDAKARNRARLFMWKVSQLKKESKQRVR